MCPRETCLVLFCNIFQLGRFLVRKELFAAFQYLDLKFTRETEIDLCCCQETTINYCVKRCSKLKVEHIDRTFNFCSA